MLRLDHFFFFVLLSSSSFFLVIFPMIFTLGVMTNGIYENISTSVSCALFNFGFCIRFPSFVVILHFGCLWVVTVLWIACISYNVKFVCYRGIAGVHRWSMSVPWDLHSVAPFGCRDPDCFPLGEKEVPCCDKVLDVVFALSWQRSSRFAITHWLMLATMSGLCACSLKLVCIDPKDICFPHGGVWIWRDMCTSLCYAPRHRGPFLDQGYDPRPYSWGLAQIDMDVLEIHILTPLEWIDTKVVCSSYAEICLIHIRYTKMKYAEMCAVFIILVFSALKERDGQESMD